MKMSRWIVPVLAGCLACIALAGAQEVETTLEPPSAAADSGAPLLTPATPPEPMPLSGPSDPQTLTLWDMVEHGGPILWVILGMGFIALVLALYLMMTVSVFREAPNSLYKRARTQIGKGELRAAYKMCDARDEMLARVVCAGLQMAGRERYVIQEAMESEGERGATALWQRISYLNNIAQLTPLLGLLGTVWGMMQAFGSIAFDEAQVKGINMAYSVSTAMVTTAAGLAVAIPVLAVYYLLRGRVTRIIATVEAQASELVEIIHEAEEE